MRELLVVDVERRPVVQLEHAFAFPLLDKLRCPLVLFVARVTRFDAIQDDPNHVGRMPFVELVLQFGIDHVIGRSDHVGDRTDVIQVVSQCSERGSLWHF